ncbi:MAG: transposase [bacterium]|nr:transposase [bacterium]
MQNIAFDKSTGEIIEGRELVLDEAKIAEEEKYDGYYSIVTSELQMSDHEIRDTYRGLSRIEETFKISKTEFESRPVFVWTNAHIEGHFATCFTVLVLIRLLQAKLGSRYPIGKTI